MSNGKRAFGTIEDRNGVHYVRFTMEGKRVKRVQGTNRKKAEATLRRLRVLKDEGKGLAEILATVFGDVGKAGITFRELAAMYQESSDWRAKKDSTQEEDGNRIRLILGRDAWVDADVATLDREFMQDWICELEDDLKPATVNRNVAAVGAVFRWAIKRSKKTGVNVNPLRGTEKPSEKGNEKERYLTPDEIKSAEKACSDELLPFFIVALETGGRLTELASLKWKDVDLKRRRITLWSGYTKTGSTRAVTLTDAALKAVKGLSAVRTPEAHLFSDHRGKQWDKNSISWWWGKVRKAIPSLHDANWHCLRHTAASLMVAAGIPIEHVSKVLGHATLQMTMRYAHFAPEIGVGAAEIMSAHMAKIRAA